MRTRLAHVRPNIASMVPMGLLDLMITGLLECSGEYYQQTGRIYTQKLGREESSSTFPFANSSSGSGNSFAPSLGSFSHEKTTCMPLSMPFARNVPLVVCESGSSVVSLMSPT